MQKCYGRNAPEVKIKSLTITILGKFGSADGYAKKTSGMNGKLYAVVKTL